MAKAVVSFEPFAWLLAFAEAKTGSKAQPNKALTLKAYFGTEEKPRKNT